MLNAILGNEAFKNSLTAALAQKGLGHAVLITAPDGCGRGFAARCLAADILYPQGGVAADAVMACQSPELLVVAGEGKSGQIPVERVRAVRSEVFRSSLSAEGRVVWIRDAHRMAPPAFNALLKVLEEPPRGVFFLLTAPSSSSVPLTIQSRCAVYSMAPLPFEVCERALEEYRRAVVPDANKALPARLARVYGGNLGLGRRALADPARLAVMEDAASFATAAAKRSRYEMLRVLAGYEGRADGDREKREAFLFDVTAVLRADFLWQAVGGPAIPRQTVAALLPPLGETLLALRGNVAPKAAFTALVVRLAQAVPPG